MDPKAQLLDDAKAAVTHERNTDYGNPVDNFKRTAKLIEAVLADKLKDGATIAPHDVATIMVCVKLARLMHDPHKRDSWVDIAGWSACGWDVVANVVPF